MMISTIFYGVNVYYYNGTTGFIVSMISVSFLMLSYITENDKVKKLQILTPIVALTVYWVNDFSNEGLIASIGSFFAAMGAIQNDVNKARKIYFLSSITWLIYGVFINSIAAILFDIFGSFALVYKILKSEAKKNE